MNKLMKAAGIASVMAAIGFAGAPAAYAGVDAMVSVNGGGDQTICTGSTTCAQTGTVNYTNGAASVAITNFGVNADIPGTPLLSISQGSTTTILNNGTGTETVDFIVGASNYTEPPGGILKSDIGGSVAIGGAANLLSMFSCVNPASNPVSCGAGVETAPVTPSITSAGSYDQNDTTTVPGPLSLYSMVEIIDFTLAAGTQLNFSSTTTLTVPEPASLAILGSALIGLGAIRRRRRKSV